MKRPEIGHAVMLNVRWYDRVPEPEKITEYQGEIIGWRKAQLIVRVRDYAVLRFWKRTGLEVGNPDHQRRGFSIDLAELAQSFKPPQGVEVTLAVDGESQP